MKMIIVIVKDHDADTLTQALTAGMLPVPCTYAPDAAWRSLLERSAP